MHFHCDKKKRATIWFELSGQAKGPSKIVPEEELSKMHEKCITRNKCNCLYYAEGLGTISVKWSE